MLTGEDIAWIIYSTILIMLTTVLAVRCRNNLLLLPFIVFAILSTISHLVMLARRYQSDSVILLADRSPIINHIPIFSLLLYAALIECQLMYIQHVNTAYQNSDRWSSLRGLDDAEKQQQRRQQQQQQQQQQNSMRLKRPKTYWANVCMLIMYTCLVVALVCVRLVLNDNLGSTRLIMALCITALAVLAGSNVIFVFLTIVPTISSSSSSTATTTSAPTSSLYRDGCFLKATMVSFTISMIGMAAEAWLFYGMIETHGTYNFTTLGWIMFETCLVYLPIFAILIMCLFVRQIHLLGLQQTTAAEARSLRFLRQRRRRRSAAAAAANHEVVEEDDIYGIQQQQRFSHESASEAANGLRRPDAAASSNNI